MLTSCSKHFRGGLVTIVVSSAKKEFTIHKDLLVFYSDYFRAALSGSFVEATEKKIELFDVKQEVFEHFHAWLYTRNLASEDEEPLSWLQLVNFWIFGDRFQVSLLQNCVMDEIVARNKRDDDFPLDILKPVYRKTAKGSLLRKVLIEFMAYETMLADTEGGLMESVYHQYLTFEMLADLVVELDLARKKKVTYPRLPKRDKCFFHVHDKDEHC